MGAIPQRALLVLGVGLALTGCGATDSGGATDSAERLYAAYARDDGAAAGCRPIEDQESPYDCEVES